MPAAAAPDAPAAAEIAAGLTAAQRQQFADDGYCIVEAAFSHAECDELIERQTALREGAIEPPAGWEPRQPDEWGRSMNQHVGDPTMLKWLVDPRVGDALAELLGEPADGIQSMYFWRADSAGKADSAPGLWHQDQTPLPGCVSAWIALEDVSPKNGTIEFQPGSHVRRAVWHEDVLDEAGATTSLRTEQQVEVHAENEAAGLRSVSISAKKGDVVYFHGRLLHRTGPTLGTTDGALPAPIRGFSRQRPLRLHLNDPRLVHAEERATRHVLANHYIPRSFSFWPPLWLTRANDGLEDRASDGALPAPNSRSPSLLMRLVGGRACDAVRI